MALNLTREADQLITDYMRRECLPSKASAVNRLIILTLGTVQQPQAQTPSQPQAMTPAAMPAMPSFGSQFKL
jgi:hypothetical protein